MIVGSKPALINVTYIQPSKDENGKKIDAHFEVIYKDDNGNVRKSDEPALVDIYFVKPEFRNFNYNKPEERIEHLEKRTVPYPDIKTAIAKEIGPDAVAYLNQCKTSGKYSDSNSLFGWPYAFKCDFQPEFYFIQRWFEKYPMTDPDLDLAFLDIETDLIDGQTNLDNLKDTAIAPVNVSTLIFEKQKEAFTFILRPKKPSKFGRSSEEYEERYKLYEYQLAEYIDLFEHKQEFINELHKEFDSTYGFIKYHLRFYEDELEMITDMFRCIHSRKPNFLYCWNMRFDIQYLYYRIIMLGGDPNQIMTEMDFKYPRCYFKVDKSTFEIGKQMDTFYCSSYTVYLCQMRTYAALRKSQHKPRSLKLNAIADKELGDKKVEYPDNSSIVNFAYKDYKKFIKYNIKDVLLQVGIERRTKDSKSLYHRMASNRTHYYKAFKETHLLRNVREIYFEPEGWIQCNNVNVLGNDNKSKDDGTARFYMRTGDDDDSDSDEESSFKGAINADPFWNDKVGVEINGVPSNNIFNNAIDYDMASFYPSIKIVCNMDGITLIFKASFDNEEFMSGEFSNKSLNTKYFEKDKYGNIRKLDITGEAVNTYVSKNILTTAYNYLGQPDITSVLKYIFENIAAL